jgi:multiple sugar transport system ATP-binding protein
MRVALAESVPHRSAGSTQLRQKSEGAAIVCNSIVKRYGEVEVVHDFNFQVNENEFVVFLGPSGCGKSTILRMIAGLEAISSGELIIGGKVVTELPPRDRGIAMVFQNYALYPHMSVYDNIAFGLRRLKTPQPELDLRVREVSNTLGLEPYLQRKPAELSGGQQQRVAIARAMIKTPKVFLFDEPLSNLDAKLRNHMRAEIARLHQRLKTTTVYVTHDQHEAMTLADRIVLLREGRIEQVGTPREIFERPRTRYVASFIGTPPMNLFEMSARRRADGFELFGNCGTVSILSNRFELRDGHRVTLGVRPGSLQLVPEATGTNVFTGVVELVEYLGNEALVSFSSAGVELSAIVSSQKCPLVGDRVSFTAQEQHLHLFDFDSGHTLGRGA